MNPFQKIQHRLPMVGLEEVSHAQEILDFDARIRQRLRKGVSFAYTVEPKIAGIAVEMVYEKGNLTAASTRGDGQVGELVTPNIKTILTVPLTLYQLDKHKPIPDLLEVRGMVYLEIEDSDREKMQGNLPSAATTRDAAMDALMQPNLRMTVKRPLNVFCDGIGKMSGPACRTHDELMSTLQLWGLRVNRPHIRVFETIEEVLAHCRRLEKERRQFPYPVEGAVVRTNEMKVQEQLGEESGLARWAMVFRFSINDTEMLNPST